MKIDVDGAELFVSIRGQGPLLLIPTAIGTAPYETQVPPALRERFRVACVDLRGGGQSTGEAAELTFDRIALDLDAVRRALGDERVVVLGHSMLGMLAVEYARRRPDSVKHAIVAGTPPFGDMTRVAAAADAAFERDASPDRKRVLAANLARLPAGATPGQALFAQTPRRFFDSRLDPAPLFAGAVYRPALLQHLLGVLAPGWNILDAPDPLRTPLFVAHGRHDYVVPQELWSAVVPSLPQARLQIFERSGHQPFFEEPETFTAAVVSWMEATGRD